MARLDPDLRNFRSETGRLIDLLHSITGLAPQHRKLIAEIVSLRLSILLENHFKTIYSKITCGTDYLDGSAPILMARQRSMQGAINAMCTLNRQRPRSLSWNAGPEVRDNVQHVIDPNDHCVHVMIQYASFLTELRYIRNHIAHRNDTSRKNFRKIVRQYYGALVHGVACGTLLLSPRVSHPPLLEVHIVTARVLIRDLVKG